MPNDSSVEQVYFNSPSALTGYFPLSKAHSRLYYTKRNDKPSTLNLLDPSPNELENLAGECERFASSSPSHAFGRLSADRCAFAFNFRSTGLLDLLENDMKAHGIYKDVWGVRMVGVLIFGPGDYTSALAQEGDEELEPFVDLILPVHHEGGLIQSHSQETQHTIDPAQTLAEKDSDQPCIMFISSYSHLKAYRVEPITKGYRVIVRYRLIGRWGHVLPGKRGINEGTKYEENIRAVLKEIVESPPSELLPQGGQLGFGLRHMYPIDTCLDKSPTKILVPHLKGVDAVLYRALDSLNLKPRLFLVYEDTLEDQGLKVTDKIFSEGNIYSGPGGGRVIDYDHVIEDSDYLDISEDENHYYMPTSYEHKRIRWISPLADFHNHRAAYTAFGNEPELGLVYAKFCIIVTMDAYA